MEPIIKKIQTAVFTRSLDFAIDGYNKATFLEELGKELGDIFDGEPVFIPIPNNAPPEIPRIILNSKNNSFSCNISLLRTDLLLNMDNNIGVGGRDPFISQKENLLRVVSFLKNKNSVINRIGFVVNVEYSSPDSVEFVKKEFVKEGKLENSKELLIRYNKASLLDDIKMNNLIAISGKKENVIMVQIDINTAPEIMVSSDFNENILEKIINYSIERTKKITKNFPNI
jgi:hypothetical protein